MLILMIVPHPVAQAGVMFLLLAMDVAEALLADEPKDTEITSSAVNVHLRNLIKLGGSERNPLSVFLTDTERDALAEVELICNAQDIKHPAAGSTFDPLGIVALDVQKLRQLGFSLEEIKELTGCPVAHG